MTRLFLLALTAAVLLLAAIPQAFASGEPQESFLYQNFVRAIEALDRAAVAHGGPELIDRSANVRLAYRGTYLLEGHFARPWAYREYRLETTALYSADRKALKSETTFFDKDKPIPAFALIGESNGVSAGGGASKADTIPAENLANDLADELEILPHEHLRQARSAAATLQFLTGAPGHDVVTYTLQNGESRALYLDATTHLLARVERIGHWKHKGDRLEWRTFTDYEDRSGAKIPLRSEAHVEAESGQNNTITEITSIEIGGTVSADDLAIPSAFRSGFETWALEKPKVEDLDEPFAYHDLGNGVYIIDVPPADSRSLLVGFADFSVIVEGGDRSEVSRRILATARKALPDKPVRYVAMTHHHPLYANGLRPFAQRGITILATPGNVDYYHDLTTRPYRIHPDEQQRKPRDPRIEAIGKTHVIKDRKQRLELHTFGYSTHTDEFVLPYVPSHKLIVTGDMVYILRIDKPRPANPRELAIDRVVRENKLKVSSIVQTWFLSDSDSVVPYAALEEHVRTPKTQASKP